MIKWLLDPLKIDKPRELRRWHIGLFAFVFVVALAVGVVNKVRSYFAEPEIVAVVVPTNAIHLDVPFTSQAPTANWGMPYQEACEEASILMVIAFLEGRTQNLPIDAANQDIIALTKYVESQGYGVSLTAREAETVIEAYFEGYDALVVENPTVDALKGYLDRGLPVIVPSAGRELGNPHFSGLGPPFHMLVLRGYTETDFITNDPGTRHGENYTYSIDTVMEAISDYNDVGPEVGAKRVIVVTPLEE